MNYFVIAAVIVFAAMLLSRVITMRAMPSLSQEQKASLVDISRKMSRYQVFFLVILMLLLVVSMKYAQQMGIGIILPLYFLLLVGYLTGRSAYVYVQLRKLEFPAMYLRNYLISLGIQTAGILIFAVLLLLKMQEVQTQVR